MRRQTLVRQFLLVTLLLGVLAVASILILDHLVDEHVVGLLQSERQQLKASIVSRMQQQGLLQLPEAPSPPEGSPSLEPSAMPVEDLPEDKVVSIVTDTISNYRLGSGGYAWLYSTSKSHFTVLRLNPAGLVVGESAADEKQVPSLLADSIFDQVVTVEGDVPRWVAVTRVPRSHTLVLGVTYPRVELAPLTHHYRVEVALLFVWLDVAALLGLWWLNRPLDTALNRLEALVQAAVRHDDRPDITDVPPEVASIAQGILTLWADVDRTASQDVHRLTHLPATNALSAELFRRIDLGTPVAVGLVNAIDFGSYNYAYGYSRGDSFLTFMASVVSNAVREKGEPGDFVAHLEGDHFVFVTEPERADAISARIVAVFDAQAPFYYTTEDRERGHILSKDRRGDFCTFPVMKVTVGLATNERHPLVHPLQIGEICLELVAFLNRKGESAYMRDRRVDDREADKASAGPATTEEKKEPPVPEVQPSGPVAEGDVKSGPSANG